MQVRRRTNRPHHNQVFRQCCVCLRSYDPYPTDAVAMSNGTNVGDVCPRCLECGADHMKSLMLSRAAELEDLLKQNFLSLVLDDRETRERIERRVFKERIARLRGFVSDGVTIAP